jgi:esterase/lipase
MATRIEYGVPTDREGLQLRLGIEKGFFREEGLDFSLKVVFGGPEIAAAFDSCALKIGEMGTPPALTAIAKGHRFKIVGSSVRRGAVQYFVANPSLRTSNGDRVSAPKGHLQWVLGVETMDQAMHKLEPFTLADVAEKITCPILVCHGEHDTIVPVELAYKTFEKIASKDKTLRIFNAEDGGAEHCQVDAPQIITATISDWMAEHLRA